MMKFLVAPANVFVYLTMPELFVNILAQFLRISQVVTFQ